MIGIGKEIRDVFRLGGRVGRIPFVIGITCLVVLDILFS